MRTFTKLSLTGLLAAPLMAFGFATATPAAADELHISFGSGGIGFGLHIDGRGYDDHGHDHGYDNGPVGRLGIIHHDHGVRHSHNIRGRWFQHVHPIHHDHRRGFRLRHTNLMIAHTHRRAFWNDRAFRNGRWWEGDRFGRPSFRSLRNDRRGLGQRGLRRGLDNNDRGNRRGFNAQVNDHDNNRGAGNRGGNRGGNNRNRGQVIFNNGGQVVVDNGGSGRQGNGRRRNRQ